MVNIVLFEPEIPANTGNIARTCAVTGSSLHLIRPLGFDISDRAVRRAGLTYWSLLDLHLYDNLSDFFAKNPEPDLWLATSKGTRCYTDGIYPDGCWLIFGKETSGLPKSLLEQFKDRCIRIPMLPVEEARCLNLSNSVAVLTYEALRQQGFQGLSGISTTKSNQNHLV